MAIDLCYGKLGLGVRCGDFLGIYMTLHRKGVLLEGENPYTVAPETVHGLAMHALVECF